MPRLARLTASAVRVVRTTTTGYRDSATMVARVPSKLASSDPREVKADAHHDSVWDLPR